MPTNKLRPLSSNTITALRFPLMVGIVFMHFGLLDGGVQGVDVANDVPAWLAFVGNMVACVLTSICVPLFFLISGYLFFKGRRSPNLRLSASNASATAVERMGLRREDYLGKLRRRVWTLLVPYLVWNAVLLLYIAARAHFVGDWSLWRVVMSFVDRSQGVFGGVGTAATDLFVYPQCVPLWFVRELMLMTLLAPVLGRLLRSLGWWTVMGLGMAWFLVWGDAQIGYPQQLLTAAFFFSAGACAALKNMDFVLSVQRPCLARWFLWIYPLIAVADALTKDWTYNRYLHNVGILVGIVVAVTLTAKLLECGRLRANPSLARTNLFLLATHTFVMSGVTTAALRLFAVDSPLCLLLLYFLVPTLTVLVCLGLYWLLHRAAPRLLAVLTGGR